MAAIPHMPYPKGKISDLLVSADGEKVYLNFSAEFISRLGQLFAPGDEEVRQLLLDLRERQQWPRAYLAAVLGVAPSVVQAWELGRRKPSGAAKKLIWLIHTMIFARETLHSHRDIASWAKDIGSGPVSDLQKFYQGIIDLAVAEGVMPPEEILSPSPTQSEL